MLCAALTAELVAAAAGRRRPGSRTRRQAGRQGAGATPSTGTTAGILRSVRDQGSTSVEMVGFAATMMIALLIGVQACVWGIAELACRHAASHALQVSRVRGGTAADGEADAATVLAQVGGSLVRAPVVRAERDDATTTVIVRGNATRVIPWVWFPVASTVTAPTEQLTSP